MNSKPIYDVHYANSRTTLVMAADLQRGWDRRQKTFGFFGQTKVPYRNDLVIRAQLAVIAQPASFDVWASTFPSLDFNCGDEKLRYRCFERYLEVHVALTPDQPWRKTQQGRPELYLEQLPLATNGEHWYDLRAWIVFHDGSKRPIPDVRVWTENHLVVPGGQFECNRRNH